MTPQGRARLNALNGRGGAGLTEALHQEATEAKRKRALAGIKAGLQNRQISKMDDVDLLITKVAKRRGKRRALAIAGGLALAGGGGGGIWAAAKHPRGPGGRFRSTPDVPVRPGSMQSKPAAPTMQATTRPPAKVHVRGVAVSREVGVSVRPKPRPEGKRGPAPTNPETKAREKNYDKPATPKRISPKVEAEFGDAIDLYMAADREKRKKPLTRGDAYRELDGFMRDSGLSLDEVKERLEVSLGRREKQPEKRVSIISDEDVDRHLAAARKKFGPHVTRRQVREKLEARAAGVKTQTQAPVHARNTSSAAERKQELRRKGKIATEHYRDLSVGAPIKGMGGGRSKLAPEDVWANEDDAKTMKIPLSRREKDKRD